MVCFRDNGSTRPPLRLSNLYRMCENCNVHLCVSHFQFYRDLGDNNSSHSFTIDDEIGEIDQYF